ncbi:MAG: lipopolysaccharide biosynthesis glycosyltransferase [uncultured bacterium]|nr:MAG: lipopolysaccharide biosynthesis glycosyltransferase [uncultured bacterium]
MGKKIISAVIIYGGNYDKKLLEVAKKSVSWCDETILINGVKGSFNNWRNEGLKKTKGEWILYIDSDEEITSDLQSEIIQLINNSINQKTAYAIPRKNIIFGKEFKHSGQYPDYQKRLFKRDKLKKWVGEVHEEPRYEGTLGHLKNSIIHHKDMTITEMIEKTNKWSEIEAQLMIDANHPPMNIFRFMSAGFREFFLRFVKEKAFLDGKEGVIYGIYQIYSKLISYAKLWEKQQYIIHT